MSFMALSSAQAFMLLAVVAAAIVVLYWLKPPPQLVVIPSMLIWNRLMDERRRSSLLDRLRWWISLLVAMLVGLSVALALSRPELETSAEGRRKVAVVLDNLAAGVTEEELRAEYPTLPDKAVPAAIAYAAELAKERALDLPA